MRCCAVPLALALLCCWTPSGAQTLSARLEGAVTDSSGAPVPSASVEVIQSGTGFRWPAVADGAGAFVLPTLPSGSFRVEVRHAGFRSTAVDGVSVRAGDAARVTVVLEIGSVVDAVSVVATPATLEAVASQAVATTFGSEEAARVPVNGRNYLSLVLAAPGVTATNPRSFTTGERMTSGGRPYLNGNRKETTSYALEGVDINQYTDNVVS